jgi:hypothetical protein
MEFWFTGESRKSRVNIPTFQSGQNTSSTGMLMADPVFIG